MDIEQIKSKTRLLIDRSEHLELAKADVEGATRKLVVATVAGPAYDDDVDGTSKRGRVDVAIVLRGCIECTSQVIHRPWSSEKRRGSDRGSRVLTRAAVTKSLALGIGAR